MYDTILGAVLHFNNQFEGDAQLAGVRATELDSQFTYLYDGALWHVVAGMPERLYFQNDEEYNWHLSGRRAVYPMILGFEDREREHVRLQLRAMYHTMDQDPGATSWFLHTEGQEASRVFRSDMLGVYWYGMSQTLLHEYESSPSFLTRFEMIGTMVAVSFYKWVSGTWIHALATMTTPSQATPRNLHLAAQNALRP